MRFIWYAVVAVFYSLLTLFIGYSLILGMGTIVCRLYPVVEKQGVCFIGISALALSIVLFFAGSYVHSFVRENFFSGGDDDNGNGEA